MIRGVTRPVLLPPRNPSDGDEMEIIAPDALVLENGRRSNEGHWRRRPGFASRWNLETPAVVDALIPSGPGIAITQGRAFALRPPPISIAVTSTDVQPVTPPTPTCYWTVDQPSGQRVDLVSGEHLDPTGAPSAVTGKLGSAVQLQRASSQYLSRASTATLQTGNIDFTVACWVNPSGADNQIILQKWAAGQKEYTLNQAVGYFEFYVSADGTLDGGSIIGATTLANVWQLVIAWHDATNNLIGIQVNTARTQSAYALGITVGTAPFNVGHNSNVVVPPEQEFFDGMIDGVGYWKNRVLTLAERLGLYNFGQGNDYPFSEPAPLPSTAATTRTYSFVTPITGARLQGGGSVTWAPYGDVVIAADGAAPVALDPTLRTATALNAPITTEMVAVMDSYLIVANAAGLFYWTQAGTYDTFPAANFNEVAQEGETLVAMRALRRVLFFWLSGSMELWRNVGGETVFAREARLSVGCGSARSVIQANDTFYWLGHDRAFYRLEGTQPTIISVPIHRRVQALVAPERVIGFDCRAEHVIRWCAPGDGLIFVHDYRNDAWSFDTGPQWNAYVEHAGERWCASNEHTGKVYRWSETYPTDNGVPIPVRRSFQFPIDANQARINRLRLRVRRGSDDTSQALVRWRLDHAKWRPLQPINLGPTGRADVYADFYRLGLGRELAIELIESGPGEALTTDCWVTAEPLGEGMHARA